MYTTPTILKPYKVQEMMFSCLRSKVAYETPETVSMIFKKGGNRDIINRTLINCKIDIRCKVDDMIDKIVTEMNHSKPIFYDGKETRMKKDAQAFTLWKNNTIYISFRGTKDLSDIVDVINVKPKKLLEDVYVHAGFAEQFMSIEEKITDDIEHIMSEYPIQRIIFTGHSMGGALATIASIIYSRMFKDLYTTCHTLGCPSLGNQGFVDLFDNCVDDSARLEVDEDLIPKLFVNKKFIHVSHGIILKANRIAENIIEPKIYSSYGEFIYQLADFKKVNEYHSCEKYIERLFSLQHVIID